MIESQSIVSRVHPSLFLAVVVVLFVAAFLLGGRVVALLLVGVGVAAALVYSSIAAAFGWEPATLELPSSQLALGSSPQLIYRRRPRKVADIPDCDIRCQLICEERATYGKGNDTRTDTERVCDMTFQARGGGTPQGLTAPIVIRIPTDRGGPTFDLGDNEVRWWLDVRIRGEGLPDDDQRFALIIGPYLDPRAMRQGER